MPYKGGVSLLYVAAHYGHKFIKTEFSDENPYQKTEEGLTALHASVACKNYPKSSSKDPKLASPHQSQSGEQISDSSHLKSAFSKCVLELG